LLARELDVPIKVVPAETLSGIVTSTQSEFIKEKFGTGSVAEATALAAAGDRARLVSTRAVSQDRTATAAIAEGDGE
jgi:cobalt-precorrin 5A hydrolase